MNCPGDYEGLDMHGLVPNWYEFTVPIDAQKALVAAIPQARLVWNNPIKAFQVVYACPGKVIRWKDGRFSNGWEILPFDFSECKADKVIEALRKWEDFNRQIREAGFKSIEDWIDARALQTAAAEKSEEDDMYDAFFGKEGSTIKYGSSQVVSRPYQRVVPARKVLVT